VGYFEDSHTRVRFFCARASNRLDHRVKSDTMRRCPREGGGDNEEVGFIRGWET
jgi:hypothetical protein